LTHDNRQNAYEIRRLRHRKNPFPRLQELELTETVSREVRPLHDAVQRARESVQRLSNAHDAAVKQHEVCMEQLRAAHDTLTATQQHYQQLSDDQLRLQPQLLRARELDTKLEVQTTRLNQASEAVTQAETSASNLAEKLKAAQTKAAQLADEQQLLLKESRLWSAWKPAAADAARWLDRVDAVIEASRQLDAAHSVLQKTSREVLGK
jgi:chromosome segregation ATPase